MIVVGAVCPPAGRDGVCRSAHTVLFIPARCGHRQGGRAAAPPGMSEACGDAHRGQSGNATQHSAVSAAQSLSQRRTTDSVAVAADQREQLRSMWTRSIAEPLTGRRPRTQARRRVRRKVRRLQWPRSACPQSRPRVPERGCAEAEVAVSGSMQALVAAPRMLSRMRRSAAPCWSAPRCRGRCPTLRAALGAPLPLLALHGRVSEP